MQILTLYTDKVNLSRVKSMPAKPHKTHASSKVVMSTQQPLHFKSEASDHATGIAVAV